MTARPRVLVVGTGLIGTSLGLALGDTAQVLVEDLSSSHLEAALARGVGTRWDGSRVDLAVACVPPRQAGEVCLGLLRSDIATTVSHVTSVQADVQAEVEASLPGVAGFCGGHPMAGREVSGPAGAAATLFLDRPWVVCPGPSTSAAAVADVRWLAEACGALPVVLPPEQHDRAVALVSHLPQVVASALAARLADPAVEPSALGLAGPGLQDTSRIAGSDPGLWSQVLAANAGRVAPLVAEVAEDLRRLVGALAALAEGSSEAAEQALGDVTDLLQRGQQGRARLPVKPSGGARDLAGLAVRLPDRPGQLAGVLTTAAEAGVNVEDLRVEHLPGRPRGVLQLLVSQEQHEQARAALRAAGWQVLGS